MKITSLEEYGIRCMLLLAKCRPDETLTLPDFRIQEGLSIPYAAKLMTLLKKAGLVKSVRGRSGGYQLSKEPDKIFLREIFEALGDSAFSSAHCAKYTGLNEVCVHAGDCRVLDIWKTFDISISKILDKITLADVANGKLEILDNIQTSVGSE
jgi:Rrf2 family transcriptional regulator, iron-sulfur cluster assembly transcription factor